MIIFNLWNSTCTTPAIGMTASSSRRLQYLPSFEQLLIRQPSIHASLFEDKVFSHEDWRRHRSAAWRHRIEPFVFFRVAVGFSWQLALVVVVSVGVGLLHTFLGDRDQLPSGSRLATPFTMITFALSLLLVFKTNSSYSRWWEGRIIWGQVVNFGRNFARQALMWFPANRPELRAAAIRWAVAAPRVLLAHLREDTDVAAEVRGILMAEEVDWLMRWSNAPLGAGTALGQLVVAAGLPEQLQAEIQKQVELYTNCAGGCERIFKTPIPPAYARHTSRFLMLYVVTSPVLLWPSTGWLTPLVAGVIAFLLLGVENIGVQVEEPFHVLPLYDICRALEANIKELQMAFDGVPAAGGAAHADTATAGSGGEGSGDGFTNAADLAVRVHRTGNVRGGNGRGGPRARREGGRSGACPAGAAEGLHEPNGVSAGAAAAAAAATAVATAVSVPSPAAAGALAAMD